MDKLFLFDKVFDNNEVSYEQLICDLNTSRSYQTIIFTDNLYDVFKNILISILNEDEITLIDPELKHKFDVSNIPVKENKISSIENYWELRNKIINNETANITLMTSGTTGQPKKVTHRLKNLIRDVKIGEKFQTNVWGFCYNPSHIAGLLVFFQAILNQNTIINLYKLSREEILNLIDFFKITHLSATSTFYRLLLPINGIYETVLSITNGGEKFDTKLYDKIRIAFPNAKIVNIYASTEAGTILKSNGEYFEIKEEYKELVKVEGNELLISSKIVGSSEEIKLNEGWYKTGDIVEIIKNEPLTIKLIGRREDIINIGGEKVNINEVEEVINSHPMVKASQVFPLKNSVVGNILAANIVRLDEKLSELELISYLEDRLARYKIPRLINFVQEINLTRTGKLKR